MRVPKWGMGREGVVVVAGLAREGGKEGREGVVARRAERTTPGGTQGGGNNKEGGRKRTRKEKKGKDKEEEEEERKSPLSDPQWLPLLPNCIL